MSKTGRNELCPCGSGKKYKKCCLGKVVSFSFKGDQENVGGVEPSPQGDLVSLPEFKALQSLAESLPPGVDLDELTDMLRMYESDIPDTLLNDFLHKKEGSLEHRDLRHNITMKDPLSCILLVRRLKEGSLLQQMLNKSRALKLEHFAEHSEDLFLNSLHLKRGEKQRISRNLAAFKKKVITIGSACNGLSGLFTLTFQIDKTTEIIFSIDLKGHLAVDESSSSFEIGYYVYLAFFLRVLFNREKVHMDGPVDEIREVLLTRLPEHVLPGETRVSMTQFLAFSSDINQLLLHNPNFKAKKKLDPFPLKPSTRHSNILHSIVYYKNELNTYLHSNRYTFTGHTPIQKKVIFQFSNSKSLYFSELLDHPYSALLHVDLWPKSPSEVENVHSVVLKLNNEWSYRDSPEWKQKRFLNRLIERNFELATPYPFFLVPEPSLEATVLGYKYIFDMTPQKMYTALPVKGLDFSKSLYSLKLDPPYLALIRDERAGMPKDVKTLIPINDSLYYVPETKFILQVDTRSIKDRVDLLSTSFYECKHQIPRAVTTFVAEFHGNHVLNRNGLTWDLERLFNLNNKNHSLEIDISDRIGEGEYRGLEICCDSNQFDQYQEVTIKAIVNFPKLQAIAKHDEMADMEAVFRKSLKKGLGGAYYSSNSKIAVRSNPEKRKIELMLYRHQGLAASLFMIVKDLEQKGVISGNMETEQFIKCVRKELDPIIYLIIKGLPPAPAGKVNLKPYISNQFTSRLKQFLDSVYSVLFVDNARTWFFLSPTDWGYAYLQKAVREKLYFLAHILLLNGKPGQPPQSKAKEIIIDDMSEAFFRAPDALVNTLAYFSNTGHKVLLNGKPVERFSSSELDVQMLLTDSEESQNWFELNPEIFFNGKKLNRNTVMNLKSKQPILYRGTYYLIDRKTVSPLDWLTYFWEQLQTGNSKSTASSRKIVQVPRSQFLELFALKTLGVKMVGPPRWQSIEANFAKLSQRKAGFDSQDVALLKKLNLPLHSFQETGVLWMRSLYDLALGGILADDMGLGKTVQSIGLLKSLEQEHRLGQCLIVVPTSLVYNWQAELQKFAPDLDYCVFQPKDKNKLAEEKPPILICTYGLLTRHSDFFESVQWNVVLFDEAQALKNIKAKRTGTMRKLKANSKFCLTGTPMENHYGEYFSLIDLAAPGVLGEYETFMRTYSLKSKRPGHEAITFLRRKTAPLVLRRHKKDILDQLPDKVETTVLLDLEKEQARIYRDIATAWNKRVRDAIDKKGEAQSQLEMLTALLRLRQVCSCPSIIPDMEYRKIPPKFELLIAELQTILAEGASVVVFTNFKKTLDQFQHLLEKHQLPVLRISGEVPRKKRAEILEQFDTSAEPMLLMMTLKTGGVGLNLTKASYVFHLEPWWNPQVEFQATDRVHRMGQDKSVNVYRFIMRETIEEKIQTLKGVKKHAFDSLFLDPGSLEGVSDLGVQQGESKAFAHTGLTAADFEYLLG
ncbi:MAG: hypothetical protein CSA81_09085 [Acidobacteria bacterium]|nr:MAG: hypothetical protein CSA81_09085 [Acidobacteriota bacterium]